MVERGPTFASSSAASLSRAGRDRARQGWSIELHHPCVVVESLRPAYVALARLQPALVEQGELLTVVADAVDGLHEGSGLRGVIHAQGLRCRECGQVEDHRADRGPFRGAHCPGCGAEDALWRYEPPFWNGGRLSRGDDVSDVSRLREAVGAANLVVAIGEAEHHRARGGINWAAGQVGMPVLIIDPEAESGSETIELGADRMRGAINAIVPHWTSQVCEGLRAREAERQAENRFDRSLHRLDQWSIVRLYEYAETP